MPGSEEVGGCVEEKKGLGQRERDSALASSSWLEASLIIMVIVASDTSSFSFLSATVVIKMDLARARWKAHESLHKRVRKRVTTGFHRLTF